MDKNSKTAVVVVHGVGQHEPGASADAVSELLLGLNTEGGSAYAPFTAETIHVPLRPLEIREPLRSATAKPESKWLTFMQERTVYLTTAWRERLAPERPAPQGKESNAEVAIDFMRLLLEDYRGAGKRNNPKGAEDSTAYQTTRLMGARTASGSRSGGGESPGGKSSPAQSSEVGSAGVHVYEMYWADLLRPDNTILSFFQGLYQVLFHLASLSRLAISSSLKENGNRAVWRWLDAVQTWAVRVLTLPIPILSVILFVALLGALSRSIPSTTRADIHAVVVSGLLGLVVCLIASRWLPATRRSLTWVLIPAAFFAVFAVAAALIVYTGGFSPWSLLALEGWAVGAGIVYVSASFYDEVREGAKQTAWALYLFGLLSFNWRLFVSRDASIEEATLRAMQIIIAVLRASWILLLILAIAALILGSIAWRTSPSRDASARAKAAVRTSRMALAMPALGIMIVTMALWSALFVKSTTGKQPNRTIATELFGSQIPEPISGPPYLHLFFVDKHDAARYVFPPTNPEDMTPNDYFKGVLIWSATPGFPVVLLLLAAGFFLLILWALPSVLSEGDPPRGSANAPSIRMGKWLSRGLDATAVVAWLAWIAAFVVTIIFPAAYWIRLTLEGASPRPWMSLLNRSTGMTLTWLGLWAGSFTVLAALAKSGSAILDILRDVDNYLRASPQDFTPRARILERYVSLLRYLAAFKDENGEGYSRIVIVAHSLGALISGDLLLYLMQTGELAQVSRGFGAPAGAPQAAMPPIRLFSMGNPVRQLLNRFFPHLYRWVREEPDNGLKDLGGLTPTPSGTTIAFNPDPHLLGVELWVNAYRSGDYVGRSLWLDERFNRSAFEPGAYPQAVGVESDIPTPPPPPGRKEMCIGAGGHVHYWDESAPDIAEMLDQLIRP